MKLVFGLGNPGHEYENTRHNLGWLAVSRLAQKHTWSFRKDGSFKANLADGRIGDEKVLLIQPLTFMNLSGECVQALVQFYKTPLEDVLVIQDELDLPFGQLAFKVNGGDAGHNGIASIQNSLGSRSVQRLRLGVGRPTTQQPAEDYVLQPFPKEDADRLQPFLDRAVLASEEWITHGLAKAMNVWNGVE